MMILSELKGILCPSNVLFCSHRELGLECNTQVQGQVLLLALLGDFGQVT